MGWPVFKGKGGDRKFLEKVLTGFSACLNDSWPINFFTEEKRLSKLSL